MDAFCTVAAEPHGPVRKPAGGYRFITVMQLAMVWWAYHEKLIRLIDLRTWFACQELVSRRCRLGKDDHRQYGLDELHRLVGGVGGEHLRKGLRRLRAAGLISIEDGRISFPVSPDAMPAKDLSGLWSMLELIQNNRRRIPVPRRTLRFIAGGARRAVIATIVGHLLRCVYYRKGECSSEGCCKASWVANVFQVTRRSVIEARKHLVGIGWLVPLGQDHWHRQRWGGRGVVNLSWARTVRERENDQQGASESPELPTRVVDNAEVSHSGFSPRSAEIAPGFSPPDSNRKLPSEPQNQKPTSGGPAGALKAKRTGGKPKMANVQPEDLSDTGRLLELFDDAVRLGVVGGSESERLNFVAAAEHASIIGSRNPCGLFAWLIRGQHWRFITQGDEDVAQERLKRHCFGCEAREGQELEPSEAPPEQLPAKLSQDAQLVRATIIVHRRQGGRGEAFHLLARNYPGWTRQRWEAAVCEIEEVRLQRITLGKRGHSLSGALR